MSEAIESFLTDQAYYGKSERTLAAYERVLEDFATFLEDPDRGPGATTPAAAERRDCMAWVHTLRGNHSESTVATYTAYVHRFYAYMVQIGAFDANPMAVVTDEIDETIDKDPTRRDITVAAMREFVADITHPLDRGLVMTLLKTGMRVGELCNLDRRDLALGHRLDGPDTRGILDGRTPAIYVPPNGAFKQDRVAANKRQRGTIIPVDNELRRTLLRWLALRPDPSDAADPVFVSTKGQWGRRIRPEAVRRVVRSYAEPRGWYEQGAGAGENVTPHYFRHFFTTHLRDRTGDRGIVKYLRGDVAEDIIDTYTHNWGDRVRELYERHIYALEATSHTGSQRRV